jgi:hypothetical protein
LSIGLGAAEERGATGVVIASPWTVARQYVAVGGRAAGAFTWYAPGCGTTAVSLPNVSGALNMSDALDMIIVYFGWAGVKSSAHIWAVFLADWRA